MAGLWAKRDSGEGGGNLILNAVTGCGNYNWRWYVPPGEGPSDRGWFGVLFRLGGFDQVEQSHMGLGELVGQVGEILVAVFIVFKFGEGVGEVGGVFGGAGLGQEQMGLELFAEGGEQRGAGGGFDAVAGLLFDGGEPVGIEVDGIIVEGELFELLGGHGALLGEIVDGEFDGGIDGFEDEEFADAGVAVHEVVEGGVTGGAGRGGVFNGPLHGRATGEEEECEQKGGER